ncbi:hypothetical protein B0I35DRAFT_254837 [Stachybotrys elegans]|uniref:Uncharacterized protein n=1 Tax=Stachybotrys elegans TaxID=80388 RepID=A0A8K0SQG6_9HYPO|nr:hypothetical protein B0I35DRAFT_254837 [Stachybotrys elegans]
MVLCSWMCHDGTRPHPICTPSEGAASKSWSWGKTIKREPVPFDEHLRSLVLGKRRKKSILTFTISPFLPPSSCCDNIHTMINMPSPTCSSQLHLLLLGEATPNDVEISLLTASTARQAIIRHPKAPGTRCPTCAKAGQEVWVIPGRCCGYCGTPCD